MFEEAEHALVAAEQHGELSLEELVPLGEDCFAVRLTPSIDLADSIQHLFLNGKEKHVESDCPTHANGRVQSREEALGGVVCPNLAPAHTPDSLRESGIWPDTVLDEVLAQRVECSGTLGNGRVEASEQ